LGHLDPAAIERVREEVRPDPHDRDELHDLLMTVVGLRRHHDWLPWFQELVRERRAVSVRPAPDLELWSAVERRPALELLFPGAWIEPDHTSPTAPPPLDRDGAAAAMVRGHLEFRGPSTVADLADATGLSKGDVAVAT